MFGGKETKKKGIIHYSLFTRKLLNNIIVNN